MNHTGTCRWIRTTRAECEYRATHHYCPHPKHACDCTPPGPVELSANASGPEPPRTERDWQRLADEVTGLREQLAAATQRVRELEAVRDAFRGEGI